MSQVKLGDVAVESRETYKSDKTGMPIVGLEHITPGEVTLSNWDTDTDNTFTKRFRKGDMLFGRRRAYLKKAAQAPFDGICSGDITVIRTKEDLLLPELLPFIIQNDNLFDFAVGKSAGSLSPRVKWDNLKNYTFELPSMEEQKKLAKALWSINDTLLAYQNLLAETDELTNAQFEILFGQGQWETVSADTVFTDMRNGVSPSSKGGYNEKVLTLSAITQAAFDPSAWKQGTFDTPPSEDKRICTEDFYMCRGNGNRALVGVGVYSTEERPDLVYPDTVIAAHIDKQKVCLPYLCCAWKQHFVRDQIEAAAKTTNGIYKINQKSLSQVQIILPPLTLQHKFSEFLFQTDKAKSTIQNTITSLQSTKRCILENALGTGRKE